MHQSENFVIDFFSLLNHSSIRYVLLRNISKELPNKYVTWKKDIDILVHPEDRKRFRVFMKDHGFISAPHPLDKGSGLVYLYAVYPFEFYVYKGYLFDVCYQMVCKSPDAGQYMPVDMIVQNSVWENRHLDENKWWYMLCREDELVHLLTRCIFDKSVFKQGYIDRIEELYADVNKEELMNRLKMVFFNYSDELIKKIEERKYSEIIESYFQFTEY